MVAKDTKKSPKPVKDLKPNEAKSRSVKGGALPPTSMPAATLKKILNSRHLDNRIPPNE